MSLTPFLTLSNLFLSCGESIATLFSLFLSIRVSKASLVSPVLQFCRRMYHGSAESNVPACIIVITCACPPALHLHSIACCESCRTFCPVLYQYQYFSSLAALPRQHLPLSTQECTGSPAALQHATSMYIRRFCSTHRNIAIPAAILAGDNQVGQDAKNAHSDFACASVWWSPPSEGQRRTLSTISCSTSQDEPVQLTDRFLHSSQGVDNSCSSSSNSSGGGGDGSSAVDCLSRQVAMQDTLKLTAYIR